MTSIHKYPFSFAKVDIYARKNRNVFRTAVQEFNLIIVVRAMIGIKCNCIIATILAIVGFNELTEITEFNNI